MQTVHTIIMGAGLPPKPSKRPDLGGRNLSLNQLDMLVWIAAQHLKHGCGGKVAGPRPWVHESEDGEGWTASERASESRTLRRLEDRGLIERLNLNGDGHHTSHVQMTLAGFRVIQDKRLTKDMLTVAGIPSEVDGK